MPKKFSLKDGFHLFLAILVSELAGVIGALFTTSEIKNWYVYLDKPFFTPPSWLFGPVWVTLYAMMGVALFLSCRYAKKGKQSDVPSYWFYAQLVVNILWSVVFFGLHSPWGGVVVILTLWLMIIKTMLEFRKVNKWAAWLLVPYLAWVTFASALNIGIAVLN